MRRACRVRHIGGFGVLGVVVVVALVRAGIAGSGEISADVLARSDIARANMRLIASALYTYANENYSRLPPDLRMLYPDYISDPAVFWHPGDSDPPPTTIDNNAPDQPNSTRISYEFASVGSVDDLCLTDPLIWDNSAANNAGWFVNKLTCLGHFKTDPPWITPTPTRREVALANLKMLASTMATYANDNDQRYPDDPAVLVPYGACSPSMFWNPGDSDPEPTQITNSVPNAPDSAQISYAFLGRSTDDEYLTVVLQDNSLANNAGLGAFAVTNDFAVAFFEPCGRSLPSSEVARDKLGQIGQALQVYAAANGGQFPARLSMLYPAYIADPAVFWNPGDRDACPTTIDNDTPNGHNSARVSYNYLGASYASACGAGVILVADNSLANNGGTGINMLTADNTVNYYAPVLPSCHTPEDCMAVSAANLKGIGTCLAIWGNDNPYLPPSLSALYPDCINPPTAFWNPGDTDPWPLTIDNDGLNQPNSAQISYEYLAAGRLVDSLGWNDILVRDNSPANNGGAGIGVVYGDGHYEFLPVSAVDFDSDGDVDLEDFVHFQACFNGPNNPAATTDCADTDVDADGDVDLVDFLTFAHCFNGPNRAAACS